MSSATTSTVKPFNQENIFNYYYDKYENKNQFYQDLIIFSLYLATLVVGSIGNLIVCYVSFVLRPKSITYLLIGNMAVSDLLASLAIPLQWLMCSSFMLNMNDRMCGTVKSLQVVSYFISTFTMALIAVDRYMIVRNPLAPRVRPWLAIALIWLASLVLNIPTLVAMRVSEFFTTTRLMHCRIVFNLDPVSSAYIRKYRVSLVVLTQYLIPLVIATTFYGLCIKKILGRQRIGECTNQQERQFYRSKMRTVHMLFVAGTVFAVLWLPVHLIHLVDFYVHPLLPKQCNASFVYNFFYWLSISSCCYNPFIYCWFDRKFRSTARMFFCCVSIRYEKEQASSSTQLKLDGQPKNALTSEVSSATY